MASSDTKTQQYLDVAANGSRADLPANTCCETRTQTLIRGVAERIMDVEDEVEELKNNPDVVDIVATYADLQAYPVSQLTDRDIIRVLSDETHNDESTYYRWSTATQTWTYIGESKQYSDFVGTDGTNAGTSGLVPAPATTDAGKFLKADGTWDEAGSSVNVVQTFGTSTTDVMSQNVMNIALKGDNVRIGYNTIANQRSVAIGFNANARGSSSNYARQVAVGPEANTSSGLFDIAIGSHASTYSANNATNSIAIGGGNASYSGANATGLNSIAIGQYSVASARGSVALGYGATATTQGEFNIGVSQNGGPANNGYNGSAYRLLTGLYDPQSDHDAATKGYVDNLVGDIESALNTINNGTGA